MKKIYTILVCLCMLAGFVACEKDKEFVLTTLTVTNETVTPSYETAEVSCSFKADATISEAYVQYSLSSGFAKYDVAKMTEEKGKYMAQLTDLVDNTTYYIRYAVSNKYSRVVTTEVKAFTTDKQPTSDPSNPSDPSDPSKPAITLPTVNTTVATQITATTAVTGGNVTNDGGAEVTERGVCIATISNPTTANTKILAGSGTGEFTCNLTGLQANTTYYVRAYAINSKGTAYGEEVTFTTNKQVVLPSVITAAVTQITETSAVAGGNVTADGNASVTERGVVYGKSPNPTISNLNNTIRPCGSGLGEFTYNMTDLQPSTTYYVRAYATNAKGTAYGEEVSFTTESLLSEPTGMENGYGYVDLGLSVKWATCNVGANNPEDYGDYFAWGETTTKDTYSWSNYKYCNGLYSSTLTKYCNNSSYGANGFTDNKTQLELSDDAARANWGGSWRMPTDAEWTELREQCTWTWTTQNGVYGRKVTSKTNGNSIFLPSAGYRIGSSLDKAGTYGEYWSSSLKTDDPNYARDVYFYSDVMHRYYGSRCSGHSVRPVLGETTIPTVTTTIPTQITEMTAVAGGNVTSEGNASVTERGVCIATVSNPTTSNTKITAGSGTGSFTCNLTGLQVNTTYYVRAYATNEKGTAYGEEESFTTYENIEISDPTGTENGYGYVDLGLSVKWATCNVGAYTPEYYGDYFAWGETTTKDTYSWSTYKYCNGSETTFTKYNTSSSYGTVDNKTQLELNDDAARVNWGGSWRMPTDAEWTELIYNCTWTWGNQNGVYGSKVTSKTNGNSIFLPAAGYRYYSSLYSAGTYGEYWSSSLDTGYPYGAGGVDSYSDYVGMSHYYRYYGLPVRPVCP